MFPTDMEILLLCNAIALHLNVANPGGNWMKQEPNLLAPHPLGLLGLTIYNLFIRSSNLSNVRLEATV